MDFVLKKIQPNVKLHISDHSHKSHTHFLKIYLHIFESLLVFYPCFIQNVCEFTKLDDIPKNLEKA